MAKPQPIIEDFAQRAVRQHDETKAKLDAASAMLAALENIKAWGEQATGSTVDAGNARECARFATIAIAQAETAGIKTEG